MKIIYRILKALFLWVTPIVVVIFSIIINATNADLYKNTFRSNSFYSNVSEILITPSNQKITAASSLPQAIVLYSLTQEFAKPDWIQNVVEQNVDLTTAWLRGEEKDWVVFIPTTDIDVALKNRLDNTVQNLSAQSSVIPTCTTDQELALKNKGFSVADGRICLPESVQKGNQKLSEFLAIPNQTDRLDSVLPNNELNQLSDRFPVSSIGGFVQQDDAANKLLNSFRWLILYTQKLTIPAIAMVFLLLTLLLILSKISGYSVYQQLQSILFTLAASIFTLSVTVIVSLGLTAYLSTWLNNVILPGLVTGKLAELVGWKIVNIIVLWVTPALWIAAIFAGLSFFIRIMRAISLRNQSVKNDEILSYKPNFENNKTLDGQFQQQIHQTQVQQVTNNIGGQDHYEKQYDPETLSAEKNDAGTIFHGTEEEIQHFYQQEEEFQEHLNEQNTRVEKPQNPEPNRFRGL